MDIKETIRTLECYNSSSLNEKLSSAIQSAVSMLKKICEKPAVSETVSKIEYFATAKHKWGFYRHVPSGKTLLWMSIGELVELAKNGGLANDKFESNSSSVQRRLDIGYVYCIVDMLVSNGYMTRDEANLNRTKKGA